MISIILMASALSADIYQDTFKEANTAYQAADFVKAAQSYEQLIASSVVDPVVFYNLGNAYYRQGKMGLAIANYERALALRPGFQSASENLAKALQNTKRNLARPLPPAWEQAIFFWHYALSSKTTKAAGIIFWIFFWITAGAWTWRPSRYLRWAAASCGILALVFGLSAWAKANRPPLAVTISEKADVRFGASENETVRFELFAGDRVTVDHREGGWARVTTVDGERGWTPENNLCFVAPPYAAPPPSPTTTQGESPPV